MGGFSIGSLNDKGQLLFTADNWDTISSDMLLQYSGGRFTPIVVARGLAPGGKWPSRNGTVAAPVSMNQLGNAVFAAEVTMRDETDFGTFVWDYSSRQVKALVLRGMPAAGNLTFTQGGAFSPVINNSSEIAA